MGIRKKKGPRRGLILGIISVWILFLVFVPIFPRIDRIVDIFVDPYEFNSIFRPKTSTQSVTPVEIGEYADFSTRDIFIYGDIAYLLGLSGLEIVDISNPYHPTKLGNYSTDADTRSIFVSNDIAYLSMYHNLPSDRSLELLNVSDPTNPTLIHKIIEPSFVSGNEVVVSGGIAYIADFFNGLVIYNVSDPSNPQKLSRLGDYNNLSRGIYVEGTIAFVTEHEDGLEIIDVSDPNNPYEITNYNIGGNPYKVFVDGDFAYVTDYFGGLKIIDISDPMHPKPKGRYKEGPQSCGIYVHGNIAYLAERGQGLKIIDVSDPNKPFKIGNFYDGGDLFDVKVIGNFAYLADDMDGFEIISVNFNPGHWHEPKLLRKWGDSYNYSQDVVVSGNIAYLADHNDGLEIIDVSNPYNPQLLSKYGDSTYNSTVNIFISGKIAYLADEFDGMVIVDVSDPMFPSKIGHFDDGGIVRDIFISGSFAYIADAVDGLEIVDISNRSNPQEIGSLSGFSWLNAIYLCGNLVYLVDEVQGVHIIDVSNPHQPLLIGTFDDPKLGVWTWDAFILDHMLYIAYHTMGIEIVDVSDPEAPTLISKIGDNYNYSRDVIIHGNYAFITDDTDILEIVDVTEPDNPFKVKEFKSGVRATGVFVKGNIVYLADRDQGLILVDIGIDNDADGLTNVEELVIYGTNLNDQDTDNDLISDGIEILFGSNPNDPIFPWLFFILLVGVLGVTLYVIKKIKSLPYMKSPKSIGNFTVESIGEKGLLEWKMENDKDADNNYRVSFHIPTIMKKPVEIKCNIDLEMLKKLKDDITVLKKNRSQSDISEITNISKKFSSQAIPREIQNKLEIEEKLPYIQLGLPYRLLEFPWELFFVNNYHFGLKYPIGRHIITESEILTTRYREMPKKNEAKFLIIGDPAPKIGKEKYGLKDAKKEAKIINKKLKKIKNVSTTLLIGKKANAERVISELKKGYDFVHYTGHARFIVEDPISQMKMESCINLNDRDLTASEIYNTLKKIPEVKRPIMVFLNACETGEEKFKSDEEFEKEISGLAQAFVRNNVNYIGSIWTIPVKMSKVFAVNFYYEILRGNSIGISLQEVKKDVYNQFVWYTLGWVSFILYGNPNLTLEFKK